jgi:carboxylate-amine ligase
LIEEYLALVDPVVDELGSRKAIDGIRKIMATGTGADRQLKVFEESKGDLKAVVDYMAKETAAGLPISSGISRAGRRCSRPFSSSLY